MPPRFEVECILPRNSVAAVAAPPSHASPLIVHTEASIGFGGQELRILAEARWLMAHDWRDRSAWFQRGPQP